MDEEIDVFQLREFINDNKQDFDNHMSLHGGSLTDAIISMLEEEIEHQDRLQERLVAS